MRNDYNDNWEEIMRNEGIPRSTDYIKAKLSMELEMYRNRYNTVSDSSRVIENTMVGQNLMNAEQSVVNDSLEQINNSFAQDGASMDKNNVRVRKMDAPVSHPSYTPVDRTSSNDRQYYGGYNEAPSYQGYTNNNGSASALILTAIAVLVVLVVFVSLFVMNSIGF